MQMEKYKNALEAKNTESGKILDTFKNQIVGLKKGIYFSNQLILVRDTRDVNWNFWSRISLDCCKIFLDRDTANEQVTAKEKLIDSYKTQSNTMKQLINRAGYICMQYNASNMITFQFDHDNYIVK